MQQDLTGCSDVKGDCEKGNDLAFAPIARELDVEDPAYLPPFGAHLPVSARDSVALGMVDLPGVAHVDAWG